MGHMNANAIAIEVQGGSITLDVALEWHLTSNHYPPVPLAMLEPCKSAIAACEEREPERSITLPHGVTWRGKNAAPAYAIVEGHHLDSFISER